MICRTKRTPAKPLDRETKEKPSKKKVYLVQAECANCRFSGPGDCASPITLPCRSTLEEAAVHLEGEAESLRARADECEHDGFRMAILQKHSAIASAAEACRIVSKLLEKGKTDFDLLKFIEENKDA